MAKKGMARPEWTHVKPHNEAPPVPEIQGKAKSEKVPAQPPISGTEGPELKVYHKTRGDGSVGDGLPEFHPGEPSEEGDLTKIWPD